MSISRLVRAMQFFHLSRKAAVLLVGVILAKSGLDIETIGLYETLMFLAMVFSFFWVESVIKGYLSVYHEWEGEEQKMSIFTLYTLFLGLSVLLVSILWFLRDPLIFWLTGDDELRYLGWLALYLLLYQPTTITAFILQLEEKWRALVYYSILHALGFLLAVAIPVFGGAGIEGAMKGLVIFAAFLHIISLFHLMRHWKPRFLGKVVSLLGIVGAPLIAYALVQSFAGVFDAWLVNFLFQDKASFAIFRFGARELPLVVPLAVGVSNLALPLLTRSSEEGLDLLRKESAQLMHIIFPLAIILIFTSHYLFALVYSDAFRASAAIFNVYLMLIIPQLWFPQTIFLARKDNGFLVYVGIVEVFVNIILSLLLVRSLGMVGIALATFIAFLTEKGILMLMADRRHGISISQYLPKRTTLIYSLLLIAAYLIVGYDQGFLAGGI